MSGTTLRIGIVGGGIGGLTAALALARSGQEVTVFERRASLDASGTGLLLQPFALDALQSIGVGDAITRAGAAIGALERFEEGTCVLRLTYCELAPALHGVGVRRSRLHALLLDRARRAGALVESAREIVCVDEDERSVRATDVGHRSEDFDVLIVADGLYSRVRGRLPLACEIRPCEWSVCSAIVPNVPSAGSHALRQYYRAANAFVGTLPVDPDAPGTVSLFWNVPRTDHPSLPAQALHARRAELASFCPPTVGWLAQLEPSTSLACFTYAEIRMATWHTRRCVVIGDAAHGLNPQLGLGANLALVDGVTLARCLDGITRTNVTAALARYQRAREPQVRYYEAASRGVVPFLQSDSTSARWARRGLFELASRSTSLRRTLLRGIAGTDCGREHREPAHAAPSAPFVSRPRQARRTP